MTRKLPLGLRCPYGAHIRRANPRDTFDPGSAVQLNISNRHRILRVGRSYSPQQKLTKSGLLFMCLNSDIERQFEFVQQTWVLGRSFNGLKDEVDPIIGRGRRPRSLTVPTPEGPLRFSVMEDFVRVLGLSAWKKGDEFLRSLNLRAPSHSEMAGSFALDCA